MTVKRLTEELRELLKKPFGRVVGNDEAVAAVKECKGKLITVGDICSYELLSKGVVPHISIYDKKSLRREVERVIVDFIEQHYTKRYTVKNEPGTINENAIKILEMALADAQRSCIKVDGEEDLMALIAIMMAENGDVVIYGQPGMGMALVKIDDEVRKKARWIFERMD